MPTKKKARHANGRLMKNGELLIESAKSIADSSDPVKIISEFIRYQRLIATMYRNDRKVK